MIPIEFRLWFWNTKPVKFIFCLIWRRWLRNTWNPEKYKYHKVVKIYGWRSALVDWPCGQRAHSTFCFWWFQ